MKLIWIRLVAMWVLMGTTSLVVAQRSTLDLYFDYMLTYEFSGGGRPTGYLLIRYNSLDGIAWIQILEDGEINEAIQLIAFDDGNYLLKNELASAALYTLKQSSRAMKTVFPNAAAMKKYLRPSAQKELISDFETIAYAGTGPDGTYRKINILPDAFQGAAMYQWFDGLSNIMPITLAEARYLGQDELLMRSEIYQENQLLHRLELIEIEHDFHRIQIPSDELPSSFFATETIRKTGINSKLYDQFQRMWNEYDRMSGILYYPSTYVFSRCFTYQVLSEEGLIQTMDFCFDPTHVVTLIKMTGEEDTLHILAFQNRQFHLYYRADDGDMHCLVYADRNQLPPLDDLDFISASGTYFRSLYSPTAGNSEGKNCFEKKDPELTERLCLQTVDFDPRAMHAGLHQYLPEYPSFLHMPTPPYQLLTSYESNAASGEKIHFILQYENNSQRTFSDEAVSRFYKMY